MEEIIEILEKEYNLYQEALKKTKEKIEIIKSKDVTKLESNIKQEEKILEEVRKIEKTRMKRLEKYSCTTLKELLLKVEDDNLKEKLKELREKLLLIIGELQGDNKIAQKMIDSSNEIINRLIGTLSGEKDFGYTQSKTKSKVSDNSLLNTRG